MNTMVKPLTYGRIPLYSKEIPKFQGFYRLDRAGRIWSCRRGGWSGGQLNRRGSWKRMRPTLSGGYFVVNLRKDGKGKTLDVHRLVLETFRGPCPEGMEGCHGDDNKKNNVLSNLRWGIHQSNMDDAGRNGKRQIGETCHMAKLTLGDVKEIRRLYPMGRHSYFSLGKLFGVAFTTISDVVKRRTWV